MCEDKKRKYKDVNTIELLAFMGKEIPYEQDKERNKQNDYKEELENRAPFEHIQRRMNELYRSIATLKKMVDHLQKHEHGEDGKPVVPMPDETGPMGYL